MPLGGRVKINVFNSNGGLIKTIYRCLRPRCYSWVIYYDCHTYRVYEYGRVINGNLCTGRCIVLGE